MIYVGFQRNWGSAGYDVYVGRITATGRIPYKLTLEQLPEVTDELITSPSITLRQSSQAEIVAALLKGLAEAGLMPPTTSAEAELKATTRHLSDMRALVFESLKPAEKLQ